MNDRTRTHEDFQLDLAAYALGSLDAADRAALEAHLETCAECQALLAEYQQVVEHYPFTVPTERPPDAALERLLERARANAPERPASSVPGMRYLWAGFAALAALLLVMLGWNLWLQFGPGDVQLVDSDSIALIFPLSGSENAEAASGHLMMDAEWDECALVASGLPVLSVERDYQLWFVREDGSRVSGAVFHPDDAGRITVEVEVPDNWRDLELVGVTEEPAGGSPTPTGPNVLLGQFASGS